MRAWNTGRWRLGALLLSTFVPTCAWAKADPEGDGAIKVPAPAPAVKPAEAAKREAADGDDPEIEVFGRVFARGSADERNDYERRLSISSARIGLEAKTPFLKAQVEAELSSTARIKDAYIRLRDASKRLRVYAGQFRTPFMQREQVSRWDLPTINRGLVDDFLTDLHGLGGRRIGAMGELKVKELSRLEASVGVFEGQRDDTGQRTGEDLAGRVQFRPLSPLTLGSSVYAAQGFEGAPRRALGLDAALKLGGWRFSAEGLMGQLAIGAFNAQLLLTSFQLPLRTDGSLAVEPLFGVERMAIGAPAGGEARSAIAGVNVIWKDRVRLQLQAERALRPGDERFGNDVTAQLAARF